MAVEKFELVDVDAQIVQGSRRAYNMVLLVQFDDSQPVVDGSSPNAVLFYSGAPKIWLSTFTTQPFGGTSFDARAVCTSKRAFRPNKKSKRLWYLACTFETLTAQQKKLGQHPLDRPAEITDGASVYAVAKHVDIEGVPILNGAKQLFNPPIELDEARGIITVTRNLADRLNKRDWINHVNEDAFDIYSAQELKIQDIQQSFHVEEFDENGDGNSEEAEFWRVSVVMEEKPISDANPNGWQPSVLNAGRKALKADGTLNKSDVRDPPWPLTTSGEFIDESDLPDDANTIDITKAYPTAVYGNMGLFA